MSMEQKLSYFLINYGNPFFVGNLESKKTFFVNKTAERLFDMTAETCEMSKIFNKSEELLISLMNSTLKSEQGTLIYNYEVFTASGELLIVDFIVGYFNEEKTEVFLEMIPQQNNRLNMALNQVNQSTRPQAILNFDEKLSIVTCNKAFHQVFESSEELRQSHFKNDLINGFPPEVRDTLMASIFNTLGIGKYFSTKIKVYTAKGEEYWYLLEMEKSTLDDSGVDKLMVYMSNIEKQVEIEEKNLLLNQYLDVVQQSTVDLLYRVDIEKNILYYYSDLIATDLEKVIPNYVDMFLKEQIIHPDDQKNYLESFRLFYEEDIQPEQPVRFSLDGRPYQWYNITGKKIYNSEGKLTEVFGALVNVEKEQTLKAEFDQTKQYFDTFQAISGESVFTIDVKTRVLNQNGEVAQELAMMEKTPDFPDSVFHMVHPEHLESYREFAQNLLMGICGSIQLRLLTLKGEFQWFEINTGGIFDEAGNVTEVVGKINNIHKKKSIEAEYSNVNQYFNALQSMTGESFYTVDVKKKVFRQKGEVAEKLGIGPEFYNFPESFEYKIYPDDLEKFRNFVEKSMVGQANSVEVRIKDKTGEYLWFEIFSEIICDEQGNVDEFIGKLNNINKEKTMEEEFSALNQYFMGMQELTNLIIFRVDVPSKTFRHISEDVVNFGVPVEIPNYIDRFIDEKFIHPDYAEEFRSYSEKLLQGEQQEHILKARASDEEYEWFHIKSSFVYDNQNNLVEIFGTMENIQQKKNLEERAYHDMMTGSLNKTTFEEQARIMIEERDIQEKHAIIFIDLDDFKKVNDSLGHSYGDSLLTTVGKRLRRLVRGDDLVGRIGGDEFAVVLKNIFNQESVVERTNIMLQSLQREFSFDNKVIGIKASVGVSLFPEHGNSYKDLISRADMAVYESKRRGKNVVSVYTKELEDLSILKK